MATVLTPLGARWRVLVAVAVMSLALLSAASARAQPASADRGPDVILSNETTHTTWSIADTRGAIREAPGRRARIIARLRLETPDGFSQSYVLLRERWIGSTAWVRLRIPMRPNGRIGWVLRRQLDAFHVAHSELVVDRRTHRLVLYRGGRAIFRAPVGVGKPSTPTPPGHFWITEAFPSSDPFYGRFALGTSDYSTLSDWPGGGIVGLHGTSEPWLIPGSPSHGCIRLRNEAVSALSHLVPIGTPLWVR